MAWLPTTGEAALFGGWNQVPRGHVGVERRGLGAARAGGGAAELPGRRRAWSTTPRAESALFGGMGATTGDTWTFDVAATRADLWTSPVNAMLRGHGADDVAAS